MKDQMLTRLLDGLVWGGVPDQQGLMDTVKKHTSKGILRQIASLCAGTPSTTGVLDTVLGVVLQYLCPRFGVR
jgi:hypothetical protein